MAVRCEPLCFRGYGNPAHPSLAGKVFSTTRVGSWSAQTSRAPPSWVGPCGCPHPGDSHSSDLCPRPGSLNSRQPWTWADFPAKGWTGSSITFLATYVCGTHAHGPCTRMCAHSHTPTDPLQAVSPPYTCWWALGGLTPPPAPLSIPWAERASALACPSLLWTLERSPQAEGVVPEAQGRTLMWAAGHKVETHVRAGSDTWLCSQASGQAQGPLPWCLRHMQPLWPLGCLETWSGFWHNFSLTLLAGPASHPRCQTCSQESTVPPGLFAVPTHHSCQAGDLLSLANPVHLWLPHTSNL